MKLRDDIIAIVLLYGILLVVIVVAVLFGVAIDALKIAIGIWLGGNAE